MIAPLWAYDTLDIEANVPHDTVNQKINIYRKKKKKSVLNFVYSVQTLHS